MSWIDQLHRTYDACYGQPQFANDAHPLTPVSVVPQKTQLHVQLHADGSFAGAQLSELADTPLFVTEDSAVRVGTKPPSNPLTDQLEYCARDAALYGGKADKNERYSKLLTEWAESAYGDAKVRAVQRYVAQNDLVRDLLNAGALTCKGHALDKVKLGKSAPQDPLKLWVRWSVMGDGLQSATWSDAALMDKWRVFEDAMSKERDFCMVEGEHTRTTQKHPARIRYSSDGCKLISSNDTSGYTFRGRFLSAAQALTVGYEATQKAHNALRWLIARQGTSLSGQTIVAWAAQNGESAPIVADSWELFAGGQSNGDAAAEEAYHGDAEQWFALRLKKALHGYRLRLGDASSVVIMGLNSATDKGRMAIFYYSEKTSHDLLDAVERWHLSMAWPQMLGKDRRFVGAPAPRDIAEAAYGKRVDDKLRKATQERLLPCIVDGRAAPRDLALAVYRRCLNRTGLDAWEFERNLGVACSLHKATNPKEHYSMSMEQDRVTRDYLFGRLLAVAEDIESRALWLSGQSRETSAARLMQRYADHPCATWRTLELQLRPYIAQLRISRAAWIALRLQLLDEIVGKFVADDFTSAGALTGEFLLGYHCQREALSYKKRDSDKVEVAEELLDKGGDAEEEEL